MRKRLFFIAPLAIIGLIVFAALAGWIVELLWNALLPPIFGWHTVTFWQALGLLVLARILFGSFGPRGRRDHFGMRRMRARWEGMTPEEREQFRQRMRERCGFDEKPAAG